ncbi:Forkhead box protein Q1 [Saguinus oedipus]|uniref:Forkhead box protein Q1 n=1 Tax=Saguinus oedipus TaxID=9490 RepID=A0ABQ9VV03_SAGOE|nr:Forkhead box protein Q1 [Saguinus oedipus]
MKLEVFAPRTAHGDKPTTDLEGAGGSDAPSPLSAAGDDSLGSDGDCAANSPAAGGGAGEPQGGGEQSAGGEPDAEEESRVAAAAAAGAEAGAAGPGTGSGGSGEGARSKPYTRRPKPPYSYIALIAMAIRDSAGGRLTLAEINEYLMGKFPFFRGSYTGWRNSVRHNLSLNDCFVKVLRDPSRPWGKDNYWMLNPNSEYTFADGVFRRRRKRLSHRAPATAPGLPPEEAPGRSAAPPPASAAQASPPTRSPARQEERASPAGKFSSSFAIDSILSKPFRSRRLRDTAPGTPLLWGAAPCPPLPAFPALVPAAPGGALLPLCTFGAGEPALLGALGAEVPPAAPPLLLAPLSAAAPAKPLRGPAASGAHLYCPLRLPAALQAASARRPGPHLPYPVETLLA